MSKIQVDTYKINESGNETIDEDGELLRVDLVLESNNTPIDLNGKISGKVTDEIGIPLIASTVTLKDYASNQIISTATTDSKGNYIVNEVPPNIQIQISASHIGYIPKTLSNLIVVPPLQTVNQNISLISILGILFGILLDLHARPIIGAVLLLYVIPEVPPVTPVLITTTTTDSIGKFAFNDIPVGKYTITAQTDIYKDVSTNVDFADPSNPVELDLQVEDYKPATIVGRITNTKLAPLSGAIVSLLTFPEHLVVTKVFSDLLGNYLITNVVPNKSFAVSAIAMNYSESTSGAILTTPGALITENLILNDVLGSIIGFLLDPSSLPVSGTLKLYDALGITLIKTTSSDLTGAFSFTGVPAGNYVILAQAPKYYDISTSLSYTDPYFPLSVTIRFTEKKTAQIKGIVLDTKSSPIASASITLKNSPGLTTVASLNTDISGNYLFTNVAIDNQYVVSAVANQYISQTSSILAVSLPNTFEQDFTLNDLLGSITGALVDSNSAPVTGSLSLYSGSATLQIFSSSLPIQTTTTDALGKFTFKNVSRGSYTIIAQTTFYQDTSTSISYTDATTQLNINVQFTVKKVATISGVVTDTRNAPIASASLTLKNSPSLTTVATTTTDSSGNYSFSNVTINAQYVISVSSTQYISQTSSAINLTSSSPVTQNFSLSDLLGSINGTLNDYNSVNVSNGSVLLYDSTQTNLIQPTLSDLNGLFTLTNVIRGNYVILAQAIKYQDVTTPISYTDATQPLTVTVTFTTKKTAKINGTVLDSKKSPLASVSLSLKNQSTLDVIDTTNSDSSGNYVFNTVAIDVIYIITASLTQYVSSTSNAINANLPNTFQVNFTLNDLLGSITGTTLDLSSNPTASSLSLYNSSSSSTPIQTITSDTSGKFTFSGVPRGSYSVTANSTLYQSISQSVSYTDATTPLNITLKFTKSSFVAVQGKVVNNKSQAIQGATVTVNVSPSGSQLATTTTDSNGNYTINSININNSFTVAASAYLYQTKTSTVFSTFNSSSITQNFTLLAPSGTIAGVTVDSSTSTPLSGVSIFLYLYNISTNFGSQIAQLTTDSSGNFAFLNVSVNQSGYQYYISTFVSGYQNYWGDYFTFSDTTVPSILGNIKLLIQLKGMSCMVKDNLGNIITNATLTLKSSPSLTVIGTFSYMDLVSSYLIGNLLQGDYIIYATASGYLNNTSSVIHIAFQDTSVQTSLTLTKQGSITGKVLNGESYGISNATVYLYYSSNSNVVTTTTSDSSAAFSFKSINPNDYFLGASASGYQTGYTGKITVSSSTVNYNVTLTGACSIVGKILDSNGYGIAGATVYIYYSINSNLIATTTANSSAAFSFTSLDVTDFFLGASASGYQTNYTGRITVNGSNTPVTYNVTLAIAGSISGKVLDQNGYGIPTATVYLHYSSNSNVVASTPVDSSAAFSFKSLSNDNYFLGAAASGYDDSYTGMITINGNNVTNYYVTLYPPKYAPALGNMVISTPNTYNAITYSATWGELHQGATSDGFFVSYLGGFTGGYLVLYINVPISTGYKVKVQYVAGDRARPLKIKVTSPGSSQTSGVLGQTSGWTRADAQIGVVGNIWLDKGSNTVIFYNDTGAGAPALSTIYFSYSPPTMVGSVPNGSKYNGAYNTWIEYWGRSVLFTVAIGGSNYGYVLMDYNFPMGGRYDFSFFYLSAGSSKPVNVDFLGSTNTFWFPQTPGSWLTDARYNTISFYSPPGTNTFKFYGSGSADAPALSYIYVDFVPYSRTVSVYDFSLSGDAYINNGWISGMNSKSGSMKVTVSVDAPGYYDLTFYYVVPYSGTLIKIKINGVDSGNTYTFSPTPDWSTPYTITVNLYLGQWTNTIEVYV